MFLLKTVVFMLCIFLFYIVGGTHTISESVYPEHALAFLESIDDADASTLDIALKTLDDLK